MGQGHALGVAGLADGGEKRRDGGAQIVAEQDGNGALQADDAGSIDARRGGEVLQHGDSGAGALHHERHEGAHQNAEHRHARHLGNHVGEHGVLGQGLHDSAHGVDAEEQKPEAEDGGADVLHLALLGELHDEEAHKHDAEHVIGQLEGDDLRCDGGADVRAHDNGNGLAQPHEARSHKTDGHDRGGAGALQHRRGQRTGQNAEEGVLRHGGQNGAHALASCLLQVVAHEVHAVQEQGQTAEQSQPDLQQFFHLCVSFSRPAPPRDRHGGAPRARRFSVGCSMEPP